MDKFKTRRAWDDIAEAGYEEQVYSPTKFSEKRSHFLEEINDGDKVLILGCGSPPHMQKDILKSRKSVSIVACDFSEKMLSKSQHDFSHENLRHVQGDTTELPFKEGSFDKVIFTNLMLEVREDVEKMYQESFRVMKENGQLLGLLPSYESVNSMDEQFPEAELQLDEERKRVWDTTGWQCFHNVDLILQELQNAGFKLNDIDVQKIGVESEDEMRQLVKIYEPLLENSTKKALGLFEEFLVKVGKEEKQSTSKYRAEHYSSKELNLESIKDISDFYRYVFNNMGHYLVYPKTFEFISSQQVFNKPNRWVSIKEMDSLDLKDFSCHPRTGEKAIFWHDPDVTFKLIQNRLKKDGHVGLLRNNETKFIEGIIFGNKTTLKKQFEAEGWENPFLYANIEVLKHNRNFENFLQKVNQTILDNPKIFGDIVNNKMTASSEIYSFNCFGVAPKVQGLNNLLAMTKAFFSAIDENIKSGLVTMGETRYKSKGHSMLRSAGYVNVHGLWQNESCKKGGEETLVVAPLSTVAQTFSLSLNEFKKRKKNK